MTCAEYSRAMAYISRHDLDFKWRRMNGEFFCLVGHIGPRPSKFDVVGHGHDLYEAVLDFQRKSGIGWGS